MVINASTLITTMTFDKANKIVQIWGRYLEYCSKLNLIFGSYIPESFLPFPKDILEEALNIVAEHYHNLGNINHVKLLQGSIATLAGYKDDEEALLMSAKLFNNPKWREAMLPVFKKFQNDWIKTQGM
jgi:hypothetical protein